MKVREKIQRSIVLLVNREGSPSKFAKKVGSTKQAVANWVSGKNAPDIEKIAEIARVYNIPMSALLNGSIETEKIESQDIKSNSFIDVPVLGSIAAGDPIDMMEIDDTFPCPVAVRNAHPNSGWLRIEGNSYSAGGLCNGMYALIDFDAKEIVPDKPFAVCVNGYAATIKAIEKLANGLKLIPKSYDPTYRPIVYDYNKDDTEEVTVIGQVVYASFPFDWGF